MTDLRCTEKQRFLTLNPAGFHAFALVLVFQTGCRESQEEQTQVVSSPRAVHSVLMKEEKRVQAEMPFSFFLNCSV